MSAKLPGVFTPNPNNASMGGGNALPISDKNGYSVSITDSEFKQNSKGTGNVLIFTLSILDGPNSGSEGNWNINLGHPNALTAKIAQQELDCICAAVGQTGDLSDCEPLHGKPFRVCVRQNKKDPQYTDVYEVRRADGSKLSDSPGQATAVASAPPPPGPPAAPAQTAPPAAAGFPPVQPPQQPPTQPTVSEVTTAVGPNGQPQQTAQPPQQPPASQWQQPPAQPGQPPAQPQPPQQPPAAAGPWNAAPPAQ